MGKVWLKMKSITLYITSSIVMVQRVQATIKQPSFRQILYSDNAKVGRGFPEPALAFYISDWPF
jgi:hypothetical protein